jgi:hypothetical protein
MRRTRWFPESGKRMLPSGSVAMPRGAAICAAEASPPSPEKPNVPVPATVVIIPFGETRRIRWLLVSASTMLPSGSSATPCTRFSCALVAGPPSPENPEEAVPATVVIRPSAVTRRTDGRNGSAKTKLPSGRTAMPLG